MKRYSKTVAQQCNYHEVENIYEYMITVYLKGSVYQFRELYRELCKDAKREFIDYCFSEVNPEYTNEILRATI